MKLFTLQYISKYRTELMGFAIIGVLIGHIIAYGNYNCPLLDSFAHGIHTPGFLFLSGFGLFYSLSKTNNAVNFYKRRFWRFYFPYLLLLSFFSLPYIIVGSFNCLRFIEQVSTLNFWINGNTDGMWYIAVSFTLYLITPPYIQLYIKYLW